MGTIADKFNYSFEAKDLIKDSINNLGGSITSETELKEYAQELDNIYDNLPKVSGEGTSITLTPTIKGKMNTTLKGDTKQTQYSGINLFQAKLQTTTANGITVTNNGNGTFTVNGTNTSTSLTTFRLDQSTQNGTDNLQNYEDGTYTLDLGIQNENIQITLMQVDTWQQFIATGMNTRLKTGTITGATGMFIYIAIKGSATINNVVIRPMFVKGSYTTSNIPAFEPYVGGTASPNPTYPQNIEVVTGTQEIKVENVNLYADIQTQTLNGMTITKTDNGYILNGTTTANTTFRGTITNATNTNKTICAKCDTAITNANIQIKTRSSTQAQLRSISLGNANTWVVDSGTYEDYYCDIYVKSGVTLNNALVQPMLLNGTYTSSNIPTYTPHQEQTQIVSLGDIELCKIGNYQDYFYKSSGKWYKKEFIGKYTFTGASSESWGIVTTYDINCRFIERVILAKTNSTILSNYFLDLNAGGTDVTNIDVHNTNGGIMITIPKTLASSTEEFNTWLSTHNTTTYRVLDTANDIEITNSSLIEQLDNLEKLKSYNGITNISSSGNLPIVLGVSALKGE